MYMDMDMYMNMYMSMYVTMHTYNTFYLRWAQVRDAQQGSRSRVGVCTLYSLLLRGVSVTRSVARSSGDR